MTNMERFILIISIISFLSIANSKLLAQSGWFPQSSGVTSPLRGVSFTDPSNGIVVGDVGVILRTTDAGTNWISQASGTTTQLVDVCFINNYVGFAVGRYGTILKTTDGGNNWIEQTSTSNHTLTSVSFTDEFNGTVVGGRFYSGNILRTTDGGDSWVIQLVTSTYLNGVSFVNINIGTAVGNDGTILRTTNGCNDWILQSSGTIKRLNDVYFTDQENGTVVGDDGLILRTSNGGTTWITQVSGTASQLTGVCFVNSDTGTVVGTGDGTILRTTDGGISWELQSGWTYTALFGVDFVNANIGTTVGFNGTILRTINGGVPVELISFTAEPISGKVDLKWTTASELNNLGFEIERKSVEVDWRVIGFVEGNETTTEIHSYQFIDNLFGEEASKLYYRLKQLDLNGSFEYSADIEVLRVPDAFSLEQNYPNPFNPATTIKYQVPELSFVTIIVYDVLGNETVTLVHEEKPAGTYKFEFSVGQSGSAGLPVLPSGIYFYQLKAGEYIETKKMILLK